ncbi:MAG TPA: cytochrome b N-terminal domain-containing protein [Balneolaceae bacterium]|nr:cytochrome b N-terminal domain-containing protein [Balneolaceae bacterium]
MKKIFKKTWNWIDDRSGLSEAILPMAKHPVPPGSGWWYVFGSGTAFCLSLQVVTGICLALLYQPSSGTAYQSLKFINNFPLGHFLRNLHFFGASGMILLMGIHMIRVFIMASYKYPREMHWITGVILLLLTVMMGFTGQMLRWDADGIWAAVVAAEQAGRIPFIGKFLARFLIGGSTVGGETLSRFYAFHVFFIPAILFLFVGFHIYLVLRNGISEPPERDRPVIPGKYREWYENMLERKGVPFFPDAAWRDVVFSFLVLVAIILLAIFAAAPKLGGPPDPTAIDVVPRPDWYLTWIFALYALMPFGIEDYVIVLGPLVVGAILLSIPFLANKGERSPMKRPWSVAGVAMVVTFIGAFWIMGHKSPWSPKFTTKPLPATIVPKGNAAAKRGVKLFYTEGCQYCHSIGGRGGHKGPDLTYIGDRLTPREMRVRIINGGHQQGGMPAFGPTISNNQLHDIVAFLQTRKQGIVRKLQVVKKSGGEDK